MNVPYEVSFKCKDAVKPDRTGKGIWRTCGCEEGGGRLGEEILSFSVPSALPSPLAGLGQDARSHWASAFIYVIKGFEYLRKDEIRNYCGVLPMRQCRAKCQFRKNCVTPSYQYRFIPGRYRLVSRQRSGEKLDLGILPSRSPRTSALSGMSSPETPH